jgi:hypothetical protein
MVRVMDKRQSEIRNEIELLKQKVTRDIDVTEHACIVRAELKRKFPNIKFIVRSDRFSGGSSVTVYHKDLNLTKSEESEISAFVDRFDGYRGDLCDNRHNVGFEYKGDRLRGATFCRYNYKWHG